MMIRFTLGVIILAFGIYQFPFLKNKTLKEKKYLRSKLKSGFVSKNLSISKYKFKIFF
jgi:hypothetical protein